MVLPVIHSFSTHKRNRHFRAKALNAFGNLPEKEIEKRSQYVRMKADWRDLIVHE
jgi:hypothetical protein